MKRRELLGLLGVSPFLLNLSMVNELSAQTASDYKALVFIFLQGGNDQTNTVIKLDTTGYNQYINTRPTLALSKDKILAINPLDGQLVGLHTSLTEITQLFNQGECAIVSNVGTLIEPVTKQQYQNSIGNFPKKLFSHSDQQLTWQNLEQSVGWLGKMNDYLINQNTNTIFSNISLNGNQPILIGNNSRCYPITDEGAGIINSINNTYFFGSTTMSQTMRQILTKERNNLILKEYAQINKRSIDSSQLLTNSINLSPAFNLPLELQNINLAKQLRMVLKIISQNQSLGMKRQVFFINHNGYDMHSNQLASQEKLLSELSKSLGYFTTEIKALGLFNQVTTFTGSDFGRTGVSNGDGSDHGWGSHHFVIGGSVNGQQIYGRLPEVGLSTPDDVGAGRLLPQYSVDQYAGTLAAWYGLNATQLTSIFPHLINFTQKDLGFMKVV